MEKKDDIARALGNERWRERPDFNESISGTDDVVAATITIAAEASLGYLCWISFTQWFSYDNAIYVQILLQALQKHIICRITNKSIRFKRSDIHISFWRFQRHRKTMILSGTGVSVACVNLFIYMYTYIICTNVIYFRLAVILNVCCFGLGYPG